MTLEESSSNYVASRRIGDAMITVVNEGMLYWAPELTAPEEEWRREMPEADVEGRIPIDFQVVHIRSGDASILVDAGFDDPSSDWGRTLVAEWSGVRRTPGLTAGLATIGIQPEDITHVLITHAHDDHFVGVTIDRDTGRVPRFPNARHCLGRGDWEANPERTRPDSEVYKRLGLIDRLGLLDLIDEDTEIAPGVTMIPTPGESPGHSVVRVSSGGETFFAVGDLFHHACEVEHLDWSTPWVDRAAMRRSRDRLVDEAIRENAVMVFTHEPFPAWGRIESRDEGYRWKRLET